MRLRGFFYGIGAAEQVFYDRAKRETYALDSLSFHYRKNTLTRFVEDISQASAI